ncbi:hypothetical protein, partial [Sphingobium yanoikuyae]|uniref:hypothetical protein n=1 Tax=Sphingobium yanoikuyae TaxID=13690 RepID=UPI0028B04D35
VRSLWKRRSRPERTDWPSGVVQPRLEQDMAGMSMNFPGSVADRHCGQVEIHGTVSFLVN